MNQKWRFSVVCAAILCSWPTVSHGAAQATSALPKTKPVLEHCIEGANGIPSCFLEFQELDKLTIMVASSELAKVLSAPWHPSVELNRVVVVPDSMYFDVRSARSAGGYLYEMPEPSSTVWVTAWGVPVQNMHSSVSQRRAVTVTSASQLADPRLMGSDSQCTKGILMGAAQGAAKGASKGWSIGKIVAKFVPGIYKAGTPLAGAVLGAAGGAVKGAIDGAEASCGDDKKECSAESDDEKKTSGEDEEEKPSEEIPIDTDEEEPSEPSEPDPDPVTEPDVVVVMPNPEKGSPGATTAAGGMLPIRVPNRQPNGGFGGLVNPGAGWGPTVRFRVIWRAPIPTINKQILHDRTNEIDIERPGEQYERPSFGGLPGTLPDPPRVRTP